MQNELKKYAAERIRSGATPDAVKQHLLLVGWSEEEASEAVVAGLVESGVPRPARVSKLGGGRLASTVEVVLNFFSFILLATVSIALGVLYFQIINYFFPDPLVLQYQPSGASSGAIHYSIATLIIAFPIYAAAVYLWFKRFREDEEKIESKLTKWLTYIVLLITAVTIVGDLIASVSYFLRGEMTPRFLLKALIIFAIAGIIFGFYFLERQKIQYKKPITRSIFRYFGWAVAAFVLLGIVLGFAAAGSPATERKRALDRQRASDLSTLAGCIANYGMERRALPESLESLSESSQYYYCAGRTADPETGAPYEYRIVEARRTVNSVVEGEFELCAVFTLPSQENESTVMYPEYNGKWATHADGRQCDNEVVVLERPNLEQGMNIIYPPKPLVY